jgi:hypothetical protein
MRATFIAVVFGAAAVAAAPIIGGETESSAHRQTDTSDNLPPAFDKIIKGCEEGVDKEAMLDLLLTNIQDLMLGVSVTNAFT